MVILGVTRLVRGDFRRPRAVIPAAFEMVHDLLPARRGGGQVFAGVASDLRLSTAPALDFVPQRLQTGRQFRPVDGGRELLALVEFARLDWPNFSIVPTCEVE